MRRLVQLCAIPALCGLLSWTPAFASALGTLGGAYAIGAVADGIVRATEPCSPRGPGTLPSAAAASAQLQRARHYADTGDLLVASRCLDNVKILWLPGIPGIAGVSRTIAAKERIIQEKQQVILRKRLERAHRFDVRHPVLLWIGVGLMAVVGVALLIAFVAALFA